MADINPDFLIKNLNDFSISSAVISEGTRRIIKCFVISTKQTIIVKLPLYQKNQKEIQSLIQEYNTLAKCSHPVLQMAIGFYHPSNSYEHYLLVPFYKNGSLRNICATDEFHNDNSIKFIMVLGIASGLKYLHNNNIVHQNLKPENILIDDLFYPILTSFGISRKEKNKMILQEKDIIYDAPELFSNCKPNTQTDVYSFGLIVNEIYSGKIPFHNMSINQINRLKMDGNVEVDELIPDFLRDTIIDCLNPDPNLRPDFNEIDQILLSNFYKLDDTFEIVKYLNKLNIEMKQKRFFRAPKQILKLPPQNEDYPEDFNDPIDWESFHKAIQPEDNKKIILVMAFGTRQSGKSKFLRTITGNQAYVSGTGLTSTTMGILIDGPYKKREIEENIVERDFKNYFNTSSVEDGTPIYFIDSQGFGDEKLENKPNYRKILERAISFFYLISNASIVITNINNDSDIKMLFKIDENCKKTRYYEENFNPYNQISFLIKNYSEFDKLNSINLSGLRKFHAQFRVDYLKEHKSIVKSKMIQVINTIPIGNYKVNLANYSRSIWYSFSFIFVLIREEHLLFKNNIIDSLQSYFKK